MTIAKNLRSLDLRPRFVGIDRDVVDAVIAGDPQRIRVTMGRERAPKDDTITTDSAGTWLVHLGERNIVR